MKEQDLEGLTLNALEEEARKKLSDEAWSILGAAETGSTYQRNLEIFKRILLKQRVFRDCLNADTSLELFGEKVSTPILVAPIGSFSVAGEQTEHDVVAGTMMARSMLFVSYHFKLTIEDLAKARHPPMAWQAYMTNGYDDVREKMKRAESLGYAAIGITVDGVQRVKVGDRTPPGRGPGISVSIKVIEKLRKETSLPFFVKGIMCEEDARIAVDAGADAIIVSNHGGRILDYSRSPVEAIPEIVQAVGNKAIVLADSGFRRGTDVLKALALGAKAVLIGRPIFWGAVADGADGVSFVLNKLTEELRRSLIICGVSGLEKLDKSVLMSDTTMKI